MKKNILYLLGIVTILVLFTQCKKNNNSTNHQEKVKVEIETYEVGTGYGYILRANGEVRIKQANIPAIQGNIPFQTEEEAQRVGEYLIKKLEQGKRPIISIQDLKDLGITLE